jgi:hypothetical protein
MERGKSDGAKKGRTTRGDKVAARMGHCIRHSSLRTRQVPVGCIS